MATRRFGPLRRGFVVAAVCVGLSLHPGARGKFATPGDGVYDAAFFEQHRENADVYGPLVAAMAEATGGLPESALDVGCGHGLLVEAWREAGVARSFGLEGSPAAAAMWPEAFRDEFYKVQNLSLPGAAAAAEATALVTSFEVGEHLPVEDADKFVAVVVAKSPRHVFFGAATPSQDRGGNPTHVNENTFAFWLERFEAAGYVFDAARTARVRQLLLAPPAAQPVLHKTLWWYPKNILAFAPASARPELDAAVAKHPDAADMRAEAYLAAGGAASDVFGDMWRRDWLAFADLFYAERAAARRRLVDGHGPVDVSSAGLLYSRRPATPATAPSSPRQPGGRAEL
mmetsp:Transcript_14552/g.50215  ORF Transcript_14552/g.50215 Transcript_14552/m.50215 type:complete len:343 (+) Transcript_14552:1464-2492(+)